MNIDAHQHFWQPARGDYGWMAAAGVAPIRRGFMPADFEPHRLAHGIDRTILVQAAPTVFETEYLLGLADATDFVAKVVGWVDFENSDHAHHLARFAQHPKFSGVRPMIQDISDVDWMLRDDVQWAYRALIAHDLTFDALGFPRHNNNFLRLFQKYPALRVVVDHGMKPQIRDDDFASWSRGITRIATETSAFCKLSGLITEAHTGWTTHTLRPYVEHILSAFGPGRVMWGSDWPVLTLNGSYGSWASAVEDIVSDPDDRAQIFGTTAAKFYRVHAPS